MDRERTDRLAVVMTCHNRREKTLACVSSLKQEAGNGPHFIIVDSGSTDGTPAALSKAGLSMELLSCPENYYWNAGMRAGLGAVLEMKERFDYCLLVNDDVVFFPGALELLFATLGETRGVCIGAIRDHSGRQSYGGVKKRSSRLAKFSLIPPGKGEAPDTFNGNCLLMPTSLLEEYGLPDSHYVHSMADYDYGLYLSGKGVPLIQTEEFVGSCEDNPIEGSWRDPGLPFFTRLRKKGSVKGLPAGDWFYFVKKNFGLPAALYHSLTPYLKIAWDAFGKGLLAFLVPVLLYLASLCFAGVFPFGEKLWYDGDLQEQFVPFYSYLHEALNGNASMLYTLSKVMGGGMADMLAYYLANPLLLLFFFFDRHSMPWAELWLSCISLGSCGLSAFSCFRRRGESAFSLALSTAYALSAGILLYHTKFMWVPGFVLLPQVILGIEELFRGKRLRYYLSLTLSLVFSYYIGFMLCLTSLLYFSLCFFARRKELQGVFVVKNKKHLSAAMPLLADYLICSVLAGLSAAFMLLPGILGLRGAKLEMVSLSHLLELTPRFPIPWLGISFLPFSFREQMLGSVQPPLIYCGLLPLLFALWYFRSPAGRREKAGFGLLLLILLASMVCTGPYQLWHGGAYPAGYETRFSFIFSFFVLFLAGRAFILGKWEEKGRRFKRLCLIWVYGGIFCNALFSYSGLTYSGLEAYRENIAFLDEAAEFLPSTLREKGERVALGAGNALNAAWTYNLPGMSSYTSNETFELRYYMQHAGLSGNLAWLGYSYQESNPALENLFGVRYILLPAGEKPRKGWIPLGNPGKGSLYENPDALPFAFFADPAAGSIPEVTTSEHASEEPEIIENALWNGLSPGAGEVYSDQDALHEAAEGLKAYAPKVSFRSWDRLLISGSSPGEERVLVIMLPEESACWQITMNGKVLPSETMLGLFTGVRLPEGDFSLELRYTPRGLSEGILFSLFGFLLFLCYNRRRGRNETFGSQR